MGRQGPLLWLVRNDCHWTGQILLDRRSKRFYSQAHYTKREAFFAS